MKIRDITEKKVDILDQHGHILVSKRKHKISCKFETFYTIDILFLFIFAKN